MTELREVDQRELDELRGTGVEGERVLSLFVGLDQPEVATDRNRGEELLARLAAAEAKLLAESDEDTAALERCLDRVRASLEEIPVTGPGLHGVGVICPDREDPRAYALRRRPGFDIAASFRRGAALEPLLESLPGPSWGVIVVDRRHGRVFRGTDLGLTEVGEAEDDVHRWHAQGGWSQARFQRGIEKETRDHVRRVCDLAEKLHERRPFDHLAVLAPGELWPVIEQSLHPYLRERLAGHVAVDLTEPSAEDVLDRCADLIAAAREDRSRELIARLEQDLGTGEQAVAGGEEVRRAVEQRRVELLLVAAGSREEETERAVEGALAQAADVVILEPEALTPFGGIAALLRY